MHFHPIIVLLAGWIAFAWVVWQVVKNSMYVVKKLFSSNWQIHLKHVSFWTTATSHHA
jgi:hypothetical protein